eukprot:scaffold25160_cov76-Skeletonema_dohrnii-CCMP3373.AAC.1
MDVGWQDRRGSTKVGTAFYGFQPEIRKKPKKKNFVWGFSHICSRGALGITRSPVDGTNRQWCGGLPWTRGRRHAPEYLARATPLSSKLNASQWERQSRPIH